MRGDRILRDAVSIGVATRLYAVSFGVLAVAAGCSVAQACVLSVVTFTGASQLTFVSVVAAGGGTAAALPPAILLAGRNGVYGLSLDRVLRRGAWRRAAAAQLLVGRAAPEAPPPAQADARRR